MGDMHGLAVTRTGAATAASSAALNRGVQKRRLLPTCAHAVLHSEGGAYCKSKVCGAFHFRADFVSNRCLRFALVVS
jgi:hypothetical protein